VQNQTPTGMQDYEGTTIGDPEDTAGRGAMAQWMDALAYPTQLELASGQYRGTNWMTVHYQSDPVDTSVNKGLYLPVSPDLLYVG
jgi:hypothetical protein